MNVLSVIWAASMVTVPGVYWLTPDRLRVLVLPFVTAALLGVVSPLTVVGMGFAVLVAWTAYRHFASNGLAIALAATLQLAPLVLWRINAQLSLPVIAQIAIPLGLAYIALRGVHYIIEAYKGELSRHELTDVVGYFFFLPTVIADPIHRFPAWLSDQRRVRWNSQMFSEGLERILYGYVKVAFMANLLIEGIPAGWIDQTFSAGEQGGHYFSMLAKGLNGYFQFAGYSDVASGFARLLGFRVMENFDAPLIKPNVQRFWSAWHISLTSWCREYVYTPVFSLSRARGLGVLAAMAVLGLWHEFTLRYLAWGLYNGAGIVAWHQWRRRGGQRLEAWLEHKPGLRQAVMAVLITVHFIFFGFVLVQHSTLSEAIAEMWAITGLGHQEG